MAGISFFNKWSIRTKILAGFLLLALLAGIGGLINARGVGEMNKSFQSLADRATPAFLALHSLNASAHDMALAAIIVALSDDASSEFNSHVSVFETTVKEVEFAHSIYENTRERVETFDEELTLKKSEFYLGALSLVDAKKGGISKEVLLSMIASLRLHAEAFHNAVETVLVYEEEKIAAEKIRATAIGERVLTMTVIFGVLETLLAVFIGFFISGYITRSLKEVQEVAKDLAGGKFGRLIAVRTDDEIGELGNTFNKMAMEVQRAKIEAEDKVREQTAELQKENERMKEKVKNMNPSIDSG